MTYFYIIVSKKGAKKWRKHCISAGRRVLPATEQRVIYSSLSRGSYCRYTEELCNILKKLGARCHLITSEEELHYRGKDGLLHLRGYDY